MKKEIDACGYYDKWLSIYYDYAYGAINESEYDSAVAQLVETYIVVDDEEKL